MNLQIVRSLPIVLVLPLPILMAQPAFEVASVKVNRAGTKGGEGREKESIAIEPGSLSMKNVSLTSCMRWAYSVRDFQIAGAPVWSNSERYDIAAKAAGPATEKEMRIMLQALLMERFHLKLRRETKDLPVFALIVAKNGPKLHTSTADGPGTMRPGEGVLIFQNVSMAEFADHLSARPFSMDRPVVDRTGIAGVYNFELKLADNADELKRGLERNDGPSIFEVIQQQLGLKLDPQKNPLDLFVVEHVEKIPVEN